MADLIHYDQPALSLISNGAECMLIRKKFFTDHASQHLLNKVRHEVRARVLRMTSSHITYDVLHVSDFYEYIIISHL